MCQDHIFGCHYFQRRLSLTNVKTWTNALPSTADHILLNMISISQIWQYFE